MTDNNTDYMRKIIDLATPKPPAPKKLNESKSPSKYEFLKTLNEVGPNAAPVTAEEMYAEFEKYGVTEDRMEYPVDMLMSSNPGLSEKEAKRLYMMLQSGYAPTHRPYHIPDEDPHRDQVYPLAADLGRRMQAAGLNLHGRAGVWLDDFGEIEHDGAGEWQGEGISIKMIGDVVLDLAIKTKGVSDEELPTAMRKLGQEGTDITGVTPEQYKSIADDLALMDTYRETN